MRQLKFRAWDKLEKRFIYPDEGYQGHYVLDLNGRFHNLQNGSGGDEYVVQQYTELKDTEMQEIYEGDVIKLERSLDSSNVKKYIGSVKSVYGSFLILGKALDDEGTLTNIWLKDVFQNVYNFKVKVVGNMFEGPEF